MNKKAIISRYISTPAGRAALAAAMTQPMRTTFDYEPPINYIIKNLSDDREEAKRYILYLVRSLKKFDNLRTAIRETHPEYEEILDKFLVLK